MKLRAAPWAVAAVAALLYLATLSRHYTGDSIEYALAIELGDAAYLLDPYHPLLHPLALLWYRLWQALGWTGQALLPLQVLNALAGALSAGLLTAIAGHITGQRALSLLAGLGFAVSGGLWMLSVEAEFATLPLAAALLVLWALFAASPSRSAKPSYAVGLALASALAFWSYASGALLALVTATAFLTDARLERALRRRQLLIYGAALAAMVLPATALFLARWSEGDWPRALAYFFARGDYSRLALADLPHGVYGFLRSLALYPRLSLTGGTRGFLAQASGPGRAAFAAYYAAVLAIVCLPAFLVLQNGRRSGWPAGRRRALAVLTVWSAAYAAFAIFWVPGDQSFWLPVLAAWWLLAALALAAAPKRRWLVGLAAAVLALGIANAGFEVLPRRDLRTNLPYQVATDAARRTGAGDLFLTRPDDITGLYLAYFGGREVYYATPDNLDALSASLAASPETAARRIYAVDRSGEGAGWWQSVLAGSGWRVREPLQLETGLLVEVTPRQAE